MIHTIIAQERRKAPRQLAIEINNDLRTQTGTDKDGMPVFAVTPRPAQLHSMGERVWLVTNERTGVTKTFRSEDEAYECRDGWNLLWGLDSASVTLVPLDDNVTYAAEWDGSSPLITVHKGDIADLKMQFAGWPMVTKEQWDAEHPSLPL